MTITDRDKRALLLAVPALAIIGIFVATSSKEAAPVVVAASATSDTSIPAAEQRLALMRQSVAQVPGKEERLKQAQTELAQREKGLIEADTAAQATEQLLQIMRRVARAQAPPVDFKSVEPGQTRAYGDAYGQVIVGVNFECKMDQLVNMLADFSARPELVATNDMRLTAANGTEKTVLVHLSVAGLVPRKLVPVRKETF
jgi:hypothetical protein